MKRHLSILLCVGVFMLLLASTASASIISTPVSGATIYYGIGADSGTLETNMLTHYFVNQTETYDTLAAGTTLTIYGSEVGPFGGYGTVTDVASGGMFAVSGSNYFTSDYNGSTSRNFSFSLGTASGGGDYEAVGFYVTSFDTSKAFNLTVTYADGTTETYNLGDGFVTGSIGATDAIYFGIVGDKLISSITVSNVQDQYGIDNVSAMNTPLPGAAWLLGTGLLGLLGYRRMRG